MAAALMKSGKTGGPRFAYGVTKASTAAPADDPRHRLALEWGSAVPSCWGAASPDQDPRTAWGFDGCRPRFWRSAIGGRSLRFRSRVHSQPRSPAERLVVHASLARPGPVTTVPHALSLTGSDGRIGYRSPPGSGDAPARALSIHGWVLA